VFEWWCAALGRGALVGCGGERERGLGYLLQRYPRINNSMRDVQLQVMDV